MGFTSLDQIETTQGASRALAHVRRLAEEFAKRKATPEELAAEIKRREDAHDAWAAEAGKHRQLVAWFEKLTKEQQETSAGKLAAEAIEQLGQWLSRTRVIGH